MASVTEVDGSILEGGGQIFRMSVALSSILNKSIVIRNIRAKRPNPGLRPHHMKELEMAMEMCNGAMSGPNVDPTKLTYRPGKLEYGGRYKANAQTGSIALVMQTTLPIALFISSSTCLRLEGRTHAFMAPTMDYTVNVFLPILKRFGGDCTCDIRKRGFHPEGGGLVKVKILPVTALSPVSMDTFGYISRIWGRSYVAGALSFEIANEMTVAARKVLDRLPIESVPVDIENIHESPETASGTGCGIMLFAETSTGCILGATALGKTGVLAEEVGTEAGKELGACIMGQFCVDSHMQDQVIIFMALARGKSKMRCGRLTQHTRTAIYIAEKLTDAKFNVKERSDYCTIECDGIGFEYT